MKTYNVGIIGYGGFGKFLHFSWEKLSNVKVLAVSDQNISLKSDKIERFYNNWHDLLNDNDIDIVSIVTPPSSHAEIACEAMEKGKHILIEKPLAITIEDGRKIIEKRNETGRIATVDYIMRFNPVVEALGALSHGGFLGNLRRVNVENYAQDSSLPCDHWFWNSNISGGILIEHGVHFIDLVNSLTDQKFTSVHGMSFYRNEKQEDQVMGNVLYDRGLIATHYHSFACPDFFEITTILFAFDLARIHVEGWIPLWGKISALVNKETKEKLSLLPGFKIQSSIPVKSNKIYCSGVEYYVEEMISGSFYIGLQKSEVYSNCVCAVMADLIKAIEEPGHSLRTKLEDGLTSLQIAVLATKEAKHGKGEMGK